MLGGTFPMHAFVPHMISLHILPIGDARWHLPYAWFGVFVTSFIPFVSLSVMNVLIIRAVRQSKKFSSEVTRARTEVYSNHHVKAY